MLNGLDLFSGIGGITLALSEWVRPIAYCEIDRYAQAVLISRMSDGLLPAAPICSDVRKLDGRAFRGLVDIIYGGFPCQDLSVAGLGKGLEAERSGLFFEILRLAKEVRPEFIFLENVPAIRKRGMAVVGHELAAAGYDTRWTTLSAAEVGAPHKRERWFLLGCANARGIGRETSQHGEDGNRSPVAREANNPGWMGTTLADTDSAGPQGRLQCLRSSSQRFTSEGDRTFPGAWESDTGVLRVANGIPKRVDRIKCLGNGVVPLQVRTAFQELVGMI